MIITGQTNNELPNAKTVNAWEKGVLENGVHRVKKIKLHEGFIRGIWINNLAIVTVKKPFNLRPRFPITERVSLAGGNSTNGKDFQIIFFDNLKKLSR